jgi:hypothetical protein
MSADSGTPTDWIAALSDQIVNVHCVCEPEVAAERFLQRDRHPGHLDGQASYAEVLTGFRELARSGPIGSWQPVLVDTSVEPDLERVVRDVGVAFALCRTAAAPDGGRATNELKPNIGSRRRG